MFGGGGVGGLLDSVGLGSSPKALYPQAGDAGGKKLYGYVDEKGAWAIKPQYLRAKMFDQIMGGHALGETGSMMNSKLHLIDKSGKQAIDLSRYKEIKPFNEGLAAVRITRRRCCREISSVSAPPHPRTWTTAIRHSGYLIMG